MTDVLGQWDAWIGEATDRLMDLDGRAGATATDQVRLDLAAAFVCRKAIADRVEQIRATPKQAAALAAQPVLDDRGELVGRDIAEAATLLGKVLDRVATTIDRDQQQQSAILADAARATTDLATATRLSEELGEMGNRVAAARTRFEAAGRDPERLRAAADDLASVRADLAALDTERTTMLQRLADLPARLDQLRAREAAVRELAARCREKVTPAPRIAVPSVDALGPAPTDADLAGLTKFHPHLLRHTAASRWLAAGGSEVTKICVSKRATSSGDIVFNTLTISQTARLESLASFHFLLSRWKPLPSKSCASISHPDAL